jgi:SNF2 family DNA or RNA helicase
MIEVHYSRDFHAIRVTSTSHNEFWPSISRVFSENAQDAQQLSAYSLQLPVWEFLACRNSFRYNLEKYNLELSVDDEVKQILAKANENEIRYHDALLAQPISKKELEDKLKSRGFVRKLTDEQTRNVRKLVSLPSGATFSVPGAGKTTEALALFTFKRERAEKLLVVCPKNAFAAWEEQVSLCLGSKFNVVRLIGGEKPITRLLSDDPDIMLVTYQQLPNVKSVLADFILSHPTFMFLDESHRIKRGSEGQWANAVLGISHLPTLKLIMSGTPLPNSLSDLIPQVSFIFPEVSVNTANVAEIIKPIFVRTTKKELKLPEVRRKFTPIPLGLKQKEFYELLRSEEARQLARISYKDRSALRTIGKSVIRLLQLVSNPALLAKEQVAFSDELFDVFSEGDGPKIEYACRRARELAAKGQKIIIWSNFIENVETISSRLIDLGADYIHGGVEAGSEEEEDTREWKIKKFHQDEKSFVLVANPAACGEGISLHTVCHYALYIDRNYNAAQYLQSEDRIHRLGLSPDIITTVEILFSPDTVDESVRRRLVSKVTQMARVLDDNSLNIEPFEPDLDSDGITADDAADFINHLKR